MNIPKLYIFLFLNLKPKNLIVTNKKQIPAFINNEIKKLVQHLFHHSNWVFIYIKQKIVIYTQHVIITKKLIIKKKYNFIRTVLKIFIICCNNLISSLTSITIKSK
jgi:hypothetical protein